MSGGKWLLASASALALALALPALAQTADCERGIAELDRMVVAAGQQPAGTGGAQRGREAAKIGELAAGAPEELAASGELAPLEGGPTPAGEEGEQRAAAPGAERPRGEERAGAAAGTATRAMQAEIPEGDRRRAQELLREARALRARGDDEACLRRVEEAKGLLGMPARGGLRG